MESVRRMIVDVVGSSPGLSWILLQIIKCDCGLCCRVRRVISKQQTSCYTVFFCRAVSALLVVETGPLPNQI